MFLPREVRFEVLKLERTCDVNVKPGKVRLNPAGSFQTGASGVLFSQENAFRFAVFLTCFFELDLLVSIPD